MGEAEDLAGQGARYSLPRDEAITAKMREDLHSFFEMEMCNIPSWTVSSSRELVDAIFAGPLAQFKFGGDLVEISEMALEAGCMAAWEVARPFIAREFNGGKDPGAWAEQKDHLREISRREVFASYQAICVMLSNSSLGPAGQDEPHLGYLFHNPDTGTEWSESHPVESGECDDAEEVRPATLIALREELFSAWADASEQRQERSRAGSDLAGQGEPVAWAYEAWNTFDEHWFPVFASEEPVPHPYRRDIRPLYAVPALTRPAE